MSEVYNATKLQSKDYNIYQAIAIINAMYSFIFQPWSNQAVSYGTSWSNKNFIWIIISPNSQSWIIVDPLDSLCDLVPGEPSCVLQLLLARIWSGKLFLAGCGGVTSYHQTPSRKRPVLRTFVSNSLDTNLQTNLFCNLTFYTLLCDGS